jgi:AraC family transcriptional regulator of adaptative response/methylated-DNA-[protein]-cysteine methyltransferase
MNGTEARAFEHEEARWEAVEGRDPGADGEFVYAVRTTGIYCRPTCRSRRPNRANVAFFDGPEGAERAGYRACKRCEPARTKADDPVAVAVRRACERLRDDEGATLADLAAEAGWSAGRFQRVFRDLVGVSPKQFAMGLRATRLRDGLTGGEPVAASIHKAGFGSIGRAYDESASILGMTPRQFQKKGEGMTIRHAIARTSLGFVLVAATDRGLCSIELGDDETALGERLNARFSGAELTGDDEELAGWVRQVVALVDRPGRDVDLPLDIRGTAFQRRVWEALRQIPCGSTATYTEVAEVIGQPSAARAVAGACASNELAVVVPCHRVVRGDGTLGGYRWGIERKRALIDGEKAASQKP